jgi:hypothetical protein
MSTITQEKPVAPAVMDLAPYTGPWTSQEAGHLLRRATFGATYEQTKTVSSSGLGTTLTSLVRDLPQPDPPLIVDNIDGGPVGQTWVDKPYYLLTGVEGVNSRARSLIAWQGQLLKEEEISLRETMVLFWHNHFAVSGDQEPKFGYRYMATLREHALGNFRDLVKVITVDPNMLRFLNGNGNVAGRPNENYSRELLELFTIGKGPSAGPGDYTNYTEQDVQEMARALTGWQDYGFLNILNGDFGSIFVPGRHDSGSKTLSHRFGNTVLNNGGNQEYSQLIDIILQQDEVARFIVRKIYRWFVYHDINEQVETEVIEPLSTIFRENDYNVKIVLQTLLGSEHFFDVKAQGPMIKNPLEFLYGALNRFEEPFESANAPGQVFNDFLLMQASSNLGMVHFGPPGVAGWKAYYQAPLFYRNWINGTTLKERSRIMEVLIITGADLGVLGFYQVSGLKLINQFPAPGNLPEMIQELTAFLLPRPLTEEQYEFLRDLVIPGLPDDQWAQEYAEYTANPNDNTIIASLEAKLRRMLISLVNMPEYQLN